MEALLHALQLYIAIACTQHQMASLPPATAACQAFWSASMLQLTGRMLHACVLGVYIFSVFAPQQCCCGALMPTTCIAEATVLLPKAQIELVKQDMACVT